MQYRIAQDTEQIEFDSSVPKTPYVFQYRDGLRYAFPTCEEAVASFNRKGWNMERWTIKLNGLVIPLEDFNRFLMLERHNKE